MRTYYKINVGMQYKLAGNKKDWINMAREEKSFKTLKEAKKYIADTYGKYKKVKMYRDDNSKFEGATVTSPIHIGWIYSWKNYDWENGKKYHFTEQHWVELLLVKGETILN